ncbi:MAG: TonB-dependent receptor, partial [Fulvivirga sp.]
NGEPIPGVTVSVPGTAIGTATDLDGKYALSVPEGSTLVFSFIGFETQRVQIGERSIIDVTLMESTASLDEVVVVAYGTQRREDVTGAISSVNAKDIDKMPAAHIGQRLQGKLPGVRINQSTGTPGEGVSFRIRGQASIGAGNAPLLVVDGFPSSIGLDAIDPNDIESISVLKDASATSLYGSRAANGVILVTTKQAKEGQTNIRFSTFRGIQNVPQRGRPNVMNAREFAQFKFEWYDDQGLDVPERYQNPEQYGPNDGTDWFDVMLNQNSPTQNYQLSISTGSEKVKSSVTASYNRQDGVMLNTFAERITARANNIFNVSDKLTFGLNMASTYRNSNNLPTDGTWNIISAGYIMDPTLNHINEDGTIPIGFSSPGMFPNPNWYRVLTERKNPLQQKNILFNTFGEYEIFEGLTYKIRADADVGDSKGRYWSPSTAQGGMFTAPPNPPTGTYSTTNYVNWQVENTVNYQKSINERHNFQGLLGYSAQKVRSESSSITGVDFPDDEISWITAAPVRRGDASMSEYSILSTFGRLNYNYENKYIVSLAIRRDGSSRFGNDRKFGTFPSVSIGWLASEEIFFKNLDNLSFLKFRASYGEVGNFNIGNYTHLSSIGNANYVLNNSLEAGKTKANLGNQLLTWETTLQGDVGLDLGLYRDRIFFLYDYYWKTTNGLLYAVDIPLASGFGNIQSNIGEFAFWGHEFSLETKNLVGKFLWNTHITFSLDRNLVNQLGTENTPIGGFRENVDFVRTEVGHPIGQFFGYVYDGVFMNQEELDQGPHIRAFGGSDVGSVRLVDVNEDGFVDVNDKTFIGDPNPDFNFGINNRFYYKNFDLDIHLVGRVGGDLFMGELLWTENIDGVFNVRPEAADRWRSLDIPGKGEIPKANSNPLHRFNNSRHIYDGSHIAARNISLGYTFPIPSGHTMKSARIYFSSQNAFIITNYPGMNPEASQNGLNGLNEGRDFAHYPVPRVFTIGADINF